MQGIRHVYAGFIPLLLLRRRNPLDVIGTGHQTRCFTWIDDVVEPIAQHLTLEVTRNQVFNLDSAEPVTIREPAKRFYAQGLERGAITPGACRIQLPAGAACRRTAPPAGIEEGHGTAGLAAEVGLEEALGRCIEYSLR